MKCHLRTQTLRRTVPCGPSAVPSGSLSQTFFLSATRGGRACASLYALPAAHNHGGRDEREGKARNFWAKHGPGQTMCVCGMWRQARMRNIAAVDRTVRANVAPIDLSDVRSRRSAGVILWSVRGWGRVAVWGVGGNENKCGFELAGSRTDFNRRHPLAGFTKPVFA